MTNGHHDLLQHGVGGGVNGLHGLHGLQGHQDFDTNQFIIDNLLEYFNNMSTAYNSPTNGGGGGGAPPTLNGLVNGHHHLAAAAAGLDGNGRGLNNGGGLCGNGSSNGLVGSGGANLGVGVGGIESVPDFRNIWENLSESQGSGAGTDTDNSSLIWTLPSSSRNSVSYSPDDFIFQR